MVLSNSPVAQGLTPETRERVLRAARDLNYKANYFARMLNNKRSHMVGILSSDLSEGYNAGLLTAIERRLIESNYLYFVSSHYWNMELIRQRIEVFAERGVEGLILINTPIDVMPNLPVVSIGHWDDNLPISRIIFDNEHGAKLALEHIHALGHRQIAFFKGHASSTDTDSRWRGFEEAAQALGLTICPESVIQLRRIDEGLNPIREGYIAAQQLLSSKMPFTALMAFNDLSAIGAINAFREAGKRIPEDISVVGFDDIKVATVFQPSLTTVQQPLTEMGTMAAQEILASIENSTLDSRSIVVPPQLIVRQSSGPPPHRVPS
jgi:LacI family transcriptional regulator